MSSHIRGIVQENFEKIRVFFGARLSARKNGVLECATSVSLYRGKVIDRLEGKIGTWRHTEGCHKKCMRVGGPNGGRRPHIHGNG